MNTPIRLTVDKFGDLLHLPSEGISTLRDSPFISNQPISYGALHHTNYHYDANSSKWMKGGNLVANEDDDDEGIFEHVPSPEYAPPPASSSHTAQPSLRLIVLSSMLYTSWAMMFGD
ncbi:hypothetical protein Golob_007859 [Gossypium lobatum]|uniref:Uncharacterized protein n=1 Tax=Gossypium lobatum TaxID=34289 RepID=A0A7J8MDN2_9ROSI|nr:hypothetical protein [Gossypium lobatum]